MGNVLRKPDTSRGFAPMVPEGDEFRVANRDSIRIDGRLDESLLGPSIHHLLLSMARLRNVVSSLRIEGERIDLAGARLGSCSRFKSSRRQRLWIAPSPVIRDAFMVLDS